MDEFRKGTVQYAEAHGLYARRGRLRVVSPGEKPPRRHRRLGSVDHPGIWRERLARTDGRAGYVPLRHHGATGAGQGVDISEFQSTTPPGFAFYILRGLNEYGRVDSRVWQHKGQVDAWGKPAGVYGIVKPGAIDAGTYAQRLLGVMAGSRWEFVPTVDVELGDASANRGYVATVNSVLRANGAPTVMGYFSTGSAYKAYTYDLFDRHWGACWGCNFPAGYDVHQWQGSPLDRDYCPNLSAITAGSAPPPAAPHGGDTVMYPHTPWDGRIYVLTGGHGGLHWLTGDEWNLEQWFEAATWGVAPKTATMDNGLRLVQLARTRGVDDWTIQNETGIDLGASAPVDGAQGPQGPEGPPGPEGPAGPAGTASLPLTAAIDGNVTLS